MVQSMMRIERGMNDSMSISLWAYNPDVCDGDYCCGECDKCSKYDEAIEEAEEDD